MNIGETNTVEVEVQGRLYQSMFFIMFLVFITFR